jgi:hypothetical protein
MCKIFGEVCRLTLATANATWDVNYRGPGFIKQTRSTVEVHTEEGVDVSYDQRCVIGYQCLPYAMVAPEAINEEVNDNEVE